MQVQHAIAMGSLDNITVIVAQLGQISQLSGCSPATRPARLKFSAASLAVTVMLYSIAACHIMLWKSTFMSCFVISCLLFSCVL